MLTIQTWGGWGDVLREISLLPCGRIQNEEWGLGNGLGELRNEDHASSRNLQSGVRSHRPFFPGSAFRFLLSFKVRHLPHELASVRADAGAPSAEAVQDLLSRCPGTRWDGVKAVPRFQKVLTRGLREVVEPFHPGLFDPRFVWRAEDEVPMDSARKHIVIQTHLEGLPAKRWPVERWREVHAGVKRRHPTACIHVLDPAGASLAGEGIIVQDQLTFPQAIRLVERCSLLISVDSWSKYVAGWKNIPQLAIVPDQTPDYPQLTASAVWRHSFRGLHKDKNLALLGLLPDSSKRARYSFGEMKNLRAEEVIKKCSALGFQ